MTSLELLAPARDLACGIAAIDHGADAVYIGAPQFGARAAAGNTVDDIRQLTEYANLFRARVYVTLNTIIYDHELPSVRLMMEQLVEVGIDAILVQDMALIGMAREVMAQKGRVVELHASTQTDNRTAERVEWLQERGFHRVVLARELGVGEIQEIHRKVPGMALEAFVHGALCVSFSGVCYASQYCFSRSANRGECAQFCRLMFDLVDADGRRIDRPRHWLSLRDMCRVSHLEEMARAGVTSFKIEGRLKDVAYVKNVVAAYSRELNKVVAASEGRFCRSSLGRVEYSFQPHLQKTFNRGFTGYFIHPGDDDIASPDTPKALGEFVGKVKEIRHHSFNVATTASFANGDGLCFFGDDKQLYGFRINRAEGNRIYPQHLPPQLRPGMGLYRNADAVFDKVLAKPSAVRKIPLLLALSVTGNHLVLTASVVGTALVTTVRCEVEYQEARVPQDGNMRTQLSKLGTTIYEAQEINIHPSVKNLFVPSSLLAGLRRQLVESLDRAIQQQLSEPSSLNPSALEPSSLESSMSEPSVSGSGGVSSELTTSEDKAPVMPQAYASYGYLYNVANELARKVYADDGMSSVKMAFELGNTHADDGGAPLLMQCRHCLRKLLGYCSRKTSQRPKWHEPLFLVLPDQRRFRLQFDCRQCQMNIYAE